MNEKEKAIAFLKNNEGECETCSHYSLKESGDPRRLGKFNPRHGIMECRCGLVAGVCDCPSKPAGVTETLSGFEVKRPCSGWVPRITGYSKECDK